MTKTALVYTPLYLGHETGSHPENPGRLLAIMSHLDREGMLADRPIFEPEALKKRLLGGGGGLFGAARAWEAFARDYAEKTGAEAAWVQQLLDRHFARAYARALLRAKRNTSGRPVG